MTEEQQQQQIHLTQNEQQQLETQSQTVKQNLVDLFQSYDSNLKQNLNKFIESDLEEQKYIEKLENFQYLLNDYESYLNEKIKAQKEAISKFFSKIN